MCIFSYFVISHDDLAHHSFTHAIVSLVTFEFSQIYSQNILPVIFLKIDFFF